PANSNSPTVGLPGSTIARVPANTAIAIPVRISSRLRAGIDSLCVEVAEEGGHAIVAFHAPVEQGHEDATHGRDVAPPSGHENAWGAFLDSAHQPGRGLLGGDALEQPFGGELVEAARVFLGERVLHQFGV